jgi:putative ABC transport system substrate-binding protein
MTKIRIERDLLGDVAVAGARRMRKVVAALGLVVACTAASAQAPGKVARVGVLHNGNIAVNGHLTRAFAAGLAELGYVEGRNLVLELRHADGDFDRLPALARELAVAKVDVLFAPSALASGAARKAGFAAPIVFAVAPDPVGEGFAASLARPGGNMTGLTTLSPELAAKRLEILRDALPKLARVAVLHAPGFPGVTSELAATENAAKSSGQTLLLLEARTAGDVEAAFAEAVSRRADALLVIENPTYFFNRKLIAELAQRHRLPTMYRAKEYVIAGGLMSYGPDYADLCRRAATHVDKILKGARPGDLPVEQPVKYELAINQRAAKALGIDVPRHLVLRADQVIE